jgi:hypothetical protein
MSDSARTIAAGRASAVLPREEPGAVPGSEPGWERGRDVSGAAPSALGAHPVGDRASDSLRRLRRTVWPSGPRADLGWPRGLALHPHGLGQHPRQTPESGREPGIHSSEAAPSRFGGGTSAGHQLSRTAVPAGRYDSTVRRCPGRPALPGCTRRGPEPRPGPRGAASLWACSQQAVILDPCPLAPRRAGSATHARNPGPANAPAAPQNCPASGGRLLAWGLGTTRPPSLG